MLRKLPWIAFAALSLAACGQTTQTTPLPSLSLHALEDCPSCGITGEPVVPVELFWAWEAGRVQVWTYGEERLVENRWTEATTEVYIRPADDWERQAGSPSVRLGCLLEQLEGNVFFSSSRLTPALQTLGPVDTESLATQTDADALCMRSFGQRWHAVRGGPSLNLWEGRGLWVLGHRPGFTGPEW